MKTDSREFPLTSLTLSRGGEIFIVTQFFFLGDLGMWVCLFTIVSKNNSNYYEAAPKQVKENLFSEWAVRSSTFRIKKNPKNSFSSSSLIYLPNKILLTTQKAWFFRLMQFELVVTFGFCFIDLLRNIFAGVIWNVFDMAKDNFFPSNRWQIDERWQFFYCSIFIDWLDLTEGPSGPIKCDEKFAIELSFWRENSK